MKLLLTLTSFLAVADAATKVAVLEFGKSGSPNGAVRRTTATDPAASVDGVVSFWDALHRGRRGLQHPGMTMVPDLFKKAHVGIVLGISGVTDLSKMPTISDLVSGTGGSVVGHLNLEGHQCKHLMSNVKETESLEDTSSLKDSVSNQVQKEGLSGVKVAIGSPEDGAQLDAQIGAIIADLQRASEDSGKNIVLHIVIEDDEERENAEDGSEPMHRRLDDEQGEGEENKEEGQEENGENAENNNNQNGNQYNGYYGYGYYNAYGEWVTPYKTMFQIQYFNVVLWTAIGLAVALFFSIGLMMNMPLEPDTLLFGESAKVLGDE